LQKNHTAINTTINIRSQKIKYNLKKKNFKIPNVEENQQILPFSAKLEMMKINPLAAEEHEAGQKT
jgi:hypothetical protein